MKSLEQKIQEKNQKVKGYEESVKMAQRAKEESDLNHKIAKELQKQERENQERIQIRLEEERVRTQPVKEFLVEYRHMQSTRHRLKLLEKQDQMLYYAGLARIM